jgi:Bacterial regulatory proteins, luxR family
LADLRALATQTLNEVHDLALAPRPRALDDLGLEAALGSLCRGCGQRFGVEVDCVVHGLEGNSRRPGEVEAALGHTNAEIAFRLHISDRTVETHRLHIMSKLGLSEFIPISKVSAQALRRAVQSVLHLPDYRARARKCADQIQRLDGPAVAAELIETAFTTRRPV